MIRRIAARTAIRACLRFAGRMALVTLATIGTEAIAMTIEPFLRWITHLP